MTAVPSTADANVVGRKFLEKVLTARAREMLGGTYDVPETAPGHPVGQIAGAVDKLCSSLGEEDKRVVSGLLEDMVLAEVKARFATYNAGLGKTGKK